MRICVVTDHGSLGGATIAAARVTRAIRAHGDHQIAWVYRRPPGPPPGAVDVDAPLAPRTRVLHRLRAVVHNEQTRALAQAVWSDALGRVLRALSPDVIHLHNLHGAGWDVEVVEACLRHAPVVWTLHDMWSLTGSCAYSFDCLRFLTGCDRACPQVGTYPTLPPPLIAPAWARRDALFSSRPALALVAPSRWLADEARAAVRGRVPVHHVPYAIDVEHFAPEDRQNARRRLGLDEEDPRPVLLAAAANLANRRKGIALLAEALARVEVDARLLLMGAEARPLRSFGRCEVTSLGVLDEEQQPAAYAAADLFVHPARADNAPLVVQEAMAGGRPVIGLPVGGVPELIGDAGWVSEAPTAAGLAATLVEALSSPSSWERLGEKARRRVLRRADPGITAAPYDALYTELTRR